MTAEFWPLADESVREFERRLRREGLTKAAARRAVYSWKRATVQRPQRKTQVPRLLIAGR